MKIGFSSVQFSRFSRVRLFVTHGRQHTRPPCLSPTSGVKLMSMESVMPSNHLILFIPFSSHLQSFPASGSFQMSQFFASGGQSYWSFIFGIRPPSEYSGLLGLTGWISLQSKGLSRSSPTPQFKSINSLVLSFLYSPNLTSIQDYWKNHSFD